MPALRKRASQEIEHQRSDLGSVRLQRKVAGIDEMDLGIGNVGPKGECTCRHEMGMLPAPCRQQRWPMLTEVRLEDRIERDAATDDEARRRY